MSEGEALLPARALFRFELPCSRKATLWSAKGAELGPEFRLPNLGELEGRSEFADVRMAWNESGLAFSAVVTGKTRTPWCRESKPADSDGLHVWIDTRDTHNTHRATRFCHWLALLPAGGGGRLMDPVAALLAINRARELPKPLAYDVVKLRGSVKANGYSVEAFVPAAALTGFDATEHPKLGFTYAVRDSELGEQTFCCPGALPYMEDPSLWCTLELVR
ncbi:MAG: hypothetical protein K1X74_02355 [Pirellulales bacterium]|nr:hypothetical protein [Pirellulales bacterium]